jgi:hypothetical protein
VFQNSGVLNFINSSTSAIFIPVSYSLKIDATQSEMMGNPKEYSSEEIDDHFKDDILPSPSRSLGKAKATNATFHIWTVHDHPSPSELDLMDLNPTLSDPDTARNDDNLAETSTRKVISRITIFDKAAQPLYPPDIYTRSDASTLRQNIGRTIPVFRRQPYIKHKAPKYSFEEYVTIVSVDVIPAKSEELTTFIAKKVAVGGLRKERTKEQWEDTFGSGWSKVTVETVQDCEIGDPVEVPNVREMVQGDSA